MSSDPIAEGLFTWPAAEPALIGGRCAGCGSLVFPMREACPRCGATPLHSEPLERRGTLWSWTSQGFLPKEPFNGNMHATSVTPWYVGLIELGGQVRVESILTNVTEDSLEIGMPMNLTIIPFRTDEAGGVTVTFAFEPASVSEKSRDESVVSGA